MTLTKNDIELSRLEEAEEIYAPEAKQVEACAFQAQGVGSSPIRSTDNWDRTFNKCAAKQIFIDGRPYSRLSFLQT